MQLIFLGHSKSPQPIGVPHCVTLPWIPAPCQLQAEFCALKDLPRHPVLQQVFIHLWGMIGQFLLSTCLSFQGWNVGLLPECQRLKWLSLSAFEQVSKMCLLSKG